MKKRIMVFILLAIACVGLVGCSSKKKVAMDDFIKAFEEKGISVDEDNKPFFLMIGAADGVTFESNEKIVIYEYNSEKDLEKAKEDYKAVIKDWTSNGRFLLEAYNQDAVDIFNSVK